MHFLGSFISTISVYANRKPGARFTIHAGCMMRAIRKCGYVTADL